MTQDCSKCLLDQPLDNFYKSKTGTNGRERICKSCKSREDRRRYLLRNPDAPTVKPEKIIDPDIIRQNRHERYVRDLEKTNQLRAAWNLANPERVKAHKANYHHRRRIRIGTDKVSIQEWIDLCDYYNNQCLACGKDEVTMDHVVPISKGGRHLIENLQPLCQSCNSSKYDNTIDFRPEHYLALS